MENNALTEYIQKSHLVQAAITEAVHRFHYDRMFSKKPQDRLDVEQTQSGDILTTLWLLQPNWRYVLQCEAKKYSAYNTSSVLVSDKPRNRKGIKVEINIE